jgi:predicted lipoprotein with Yx(FWY)xxD motif
VTFLITGVAVAVAVMLVVVLTRPSAKGDRRGFAARRTGVADLSVRGTRLGRILVGANQHTLYLFRDDSHGRSSCTGGCARVWPPVIVEGTPRIGPGLSSAKAGTTVRSDGSRQLVYNGHPLYELSADSRPGQTQGQGFLGTWFVVSPSGRQVGKAHGGGGY